jgi:hypothetical protein
MQTLSQLSARETALSHNSIPNQDVSGADSFSLAGSHVAGVSAIDTNRSGNDLSDVRPRTGLKSSVAPASDSLSFSPTCPHRAGVPPENASARLPALAEAFSFPANRSGLDPVDLVARAASASTEPNDGMATCRSTATVQTLVGCCPERSVTETEPPGAVMDRAGISPSIDRGSRGDEALTANPQSAICNPKSLKAHQLREGQRKLVRIVRALELKAALHTWESIEAALATPAATLIRWIHSAALNLSQRIGRSISADNLHSEICNLQSRDCAPQNHKAGRPPKHPFTPEQIAQIKAIALPINRNYKDTSIPEAVRRYVGSSDPLARLPGEGSAQDIFRDREERGLPLLTDAQRAQVSLTELQVRAYRSPNEANLDYVQSPGSLMLTRDPVTGEERFWQPGEAYTIDDGSINFGCCVPMERPGDKCWEKFGVIVGRFQFIPVVDHRTRAILGFSYTARPRDSYRAEDLTATMQTVFAEHGLPRVMFLEYGVSDSRLVNETLARAGVEARHVKSPHEKVVEKAFDLLWTKLSSMPGQVGRFRGEMEDENALLTACKQGQKDPRKYFPTLPEVLKALRQAVAEQNAQWMNSPQYGRWQPGPWFARDAHKATRKLHPQDAWMFSPVITRPLIVRGFCVQTSVPLMAGFSLKFHFGADFLADHIGDEVILHFNPFAPDCEAMVVHARSGQLLGPAEQINRHARFTRRAFGYGADPDIGHIAARKHAQALHRTVAAIKVGTVEVGSVAPRGPSGQIASATAEHRDGLGNLVRAEVGTVPARQGPPRGPQKNVGCNVTLPPSAQDNPEQTATRKSTRSRLAAIASKLREDA